MIYAAAGALGPLSPAQTSALLESMALALPSVAAELDAVLGQAAQTAWSRNWDAVEVARQTGRRLGDRHARYVSDVVERHVGGSRWWVSGQPHLTQWAAREGLSPMDALACALEVLGFLMRLPTLPRLGGPSSEPARRSRRPGQDGRILEKVRALLAKAESTTFPEEAEALSAKAQELMARHSIDEAMVGAAEGFPDAPAGVRLPVDEPYAGAKSILLSVVASTNRCRAVWSKELAFSTVLGFASDLAFVEILYTSLLVQAPRSTATVVPAPGRSGTRFSSPMQTGSATVSGRPRPSAMLRPPSSTGWRWCRS